MIRWVRCIQLNRTEYNVIKILHVVLMLEKIEDGALRAKEKYSERN